MTEDHDAQIRNLEGLLVIYRRVHDRAERNLASAEQVRDDAAEAIVATGVLLDLARESRPPGTVTGLKPRLRPEDGS